MPISRKTWPRCFAHVDMMSFFASIEQMDFPEYAGMPLVVTNGETGTTIITSSYEARAYGIKTGTKIYDALKVCPHLIRRPTRVHRYVEISQAIMKSLENITPDIEIYSIDEAWLDLSGVLGLHESIESLAQFIRETVFHASHGLPCSIGISEGKLTAKYCGELRKGGTTIVPANCIAHVIGQAKVEHICGIGPNITGYLNGLGIVYCKDLKSRPMSILSQRFGNIGKRLYLTCLGHDPEPLNKEPDIQKSMGHGKVLPPRCNDLELISANLHFQVERLMARMRKHHLSAKLFFVGFKTKQGWLGDRIAFSKPIQNATLLWQQITPLLERCTGHIIRQVQVTALELFDANIEQLDLFDTSSESDDKLKKVDQIRDHIQQKFGSTSLTQASLMKTTEKSIAVIAPAWRRSGVRQCIN